MRRAVETFGVGGVAEDKSTGTVTALRRYPVKSMLGEDLDAGTIIDSGLEGDRVAAVIDVETGDVASAKHPRLWRGLLAWAAEWNDGDPLMSLPGTGAPVTVSDPKAERVLSEILGRDVRVATTRPDGAAVGRPDPRDVIAAGDDAEVPYEMLRIGQGTPAANFVDYAPVHLVTTATLEHVGAEMIRYRPNLLLDLPGAAPFAENDWPGRTITIGPVRLRVVVPTPRCAVPTLAHGALPRRVDAVRRLLDENRVPFPDATPQPCLGAYAQVVIGGGISVGDRAAVGNRAAVG